MHLLFFLLLLLQTLHVTFSSTSCNNNDNETTTTLILKIGGSSITHKSQIETLNQTAINWFANTLLSFFSAQPTAATSSSTRIIIIHGAGSFGHFQAREYGFCGVESQCSIGSKPQPQESSSQQRRSMMIEGLSKTRLSVQKLHFQVLKTFVESGINAVGVSPFSLYDSQQQNPQLLVNAISKIVNGGWIPVIHGDAVYLPEEEKDVVRILSGDTIVQLLATGLKGNVKVVFLTDVDGVFTSDPKIDENAELVELIEVDDGEDVVIRAGKGHEHDVTGGLEAKLRAAVRIAQNGVEVTIVKCGSVSAEQAIRGESVDMGTVVRLSKG